MAKLSGSSSSSNSHHHLGHLPVWLLSALRAAKMEGKASGVLKQVRHQVASFIRAKLAAVKGKTSAVKTQFIIFRLLHNRKVLMSVISEKIHTLISTSQLHEIKQEAGADASNDGGSTMIARHNDAQVVSSSEEAPPAEARSCETCTVESGGTTGRREILSMTEEDEEADQMSYYPDRLIISNRSLNFVDDKVADAGRIESATDVAKKSQREYLQGDQSVALDEEIDQVAELFIKRFRRQMMLERLDSIRRHQEGGA